jgi:hypothetical protein
MNELTAMYLALFGWERHETCGQSVWLHTSGIVVYVQEMEQ